MNNILLQYTGDHCICIFVSGPEMQILDYVTQQYKLLPEIANSYALKMASRFMMEMYVTSKGEIQEGDLSSLPVVNILIHNYKLHWNMKYLELHIVSCNKCRAKGLFYRDGMSRNRGTLLRIVACAVSCVCRCVGRLVEDWATHLLVDCRTYICAL